MGCATLVKTSCLVLGLLLIGAGVLIKWGLFPSILNSMVTEQLQLDPNNEEVWDTWVEPSSQIPVYMKFTFFNVTNPEEIKKGEKPIVQEVGPFAYAEDRKKVGISVVEDTITFGSYIGYSLDESASCDICRKDTLVTVINPALVGVVAMVESIVATVDPAMQDLARGAIYGILEACITGDEDLCEPGFEDDLFSTQTADELIFTGYRPGSLGAILYYLPVLLEEFGNLLPDGEFEIPDIIADGSFAFFKGKDGTADNGWYKIDSGLYNMNKYQHILEYNGQPKLPESWWGNLPKTPSANRSGVHGSCHDLSGTDGTQYPPFVDKERNLWLFSSDLCRSIYLSYAEDVDMDGVDTYQFRVKSEVLSFSNPENACYCPNVEQCVKEKEDEDAWDFSDCHYCRDGMLDLTGCQGAPVIISLPHFLDADQETQEAIQGIQPNPDLHTTYLNIEPMTGVALDAHKRIQVNVPLTKNEIISVLKNVQESVFPVVWVDEGASIDQKNLDKLKKQLVSPITAVDIGVGFAIGVGALILVVLAVITLCSRSKKNVQKV